MKISSLPAVTALCIASIGGAYRLFNVDAMAVPSNARESESSNSSACYMTNEDGFELDLSDICGTHPNSDGAESQEPMYTFETLEGTTVEISQSEYREITLALEAEIGRALDAAAAEQGIPSVTEDPAYQAMTELCQNPNNCTQENLDKLSIEGGLE